MVKRGRLPRTPPNVFLKSGIILMRPYVAKGELMKFAANADVVKGSMTEARANQVRDCR